MSTLNHLNAFCNLLDGELPKAVLFDLDGTLVDSVPDLAAAIDLALMDAQLPIAGEKNVRDWVGNGAQVLVFRAVSAAWKVFSAQNVDVTDDEKHAKEALVYERFLYHYGHLPESKQSSCLYDGVYQLLSLLSSRGIKLALVTNKPAQFTPAILRQFALDDFFDVVVCGDTLECKKPSPGPLLYAVNQYGFEVEQCVMVGDSKNDIQAAKACKMKSISVAWGYNYSEDPKLLAADLHISHFSALF